MAVISGRITSSGQPVGNLTVQCHESVIIGIEIDDFKPCRSSAPQLRSVGTATTDANGEFRVAYTPREEPEFACRFSASVAVRVLDQGELLWTSPSQTARPSNRFEHDLTGLPPDEEPGAQVRGRLTACGRPAAGFAVMVTEFVRIGLPTPRKPCEITQRTRVVGRTVTDAEGAFALSFDPTDEIPGLCAFSAQLRVSVFEDTTEVWRSSLLGVRPIVTVDAELFPDCPADGTTIRVLDDLGRRLPGAEVYVDGRLRGVTDRLGDLRVNPRLHTGAEVAARKRVHEQPSSRDGHDDDSEQNWAYRVYLTSVAVRHDSNGNDVQLPLTRVDDPDETVRVTVSRRNTLVGFNLTASLEWDAGTLEMRRYYDRLEDMSELLFNATDGQFLVERLTLADNAVGWDSADFRIYANLNQPSNSSLGGISSDGRGVFMNPVDALYPAPALHELGHYAMGVRDEYEPDDDTDDDDFTPCTAKSGVPNSPFSDGAGKDSCLMRGNWFKNRKKFCSSHPDNPHVLNSEQGLQDCWSDLLETYADPARWRLMSPTTRGAIVDQLPDSGLAPTQTDPPPAALDVARFIPVEGWQPRKHVRLHDRGPLVGVTVRAQLNGAPARGVAVTLEEKRTGRRLLQGKTKDEYSLPYGVSTGDGEVPLRGAHVGDRVQLLGKVDGRLVAGSAEITRSDPHTLVVSLRRLLPWPFGGLPQLSLERPGVVRGRGSRRELLRAEGMETTLAARVPGVETPVGLALRPDGSTAELEPVPAEGVIDLTATALMPDGEVVTHSYAAAYAAVRPDEPVRMRSGDGRLRIRVSGPTGRRLRSDPGRVSIEPFTEEPDWGTGTQVVSGPYRVLHSAGLILTDVRLVFAIPPVELDPTRRDWAAGLVVVVSRDGGQTWEETRATPVSSAFVIAGTVEQLNACALLRRD